MVPYIEMERILFPNGMCYFYIILVYIKTHGT
jgi:hypothetical protein